MLRRTTKTKWIVAVALAALIVATSLLTARHAQAYDFKAPTKLAQTMGGSTQLEVE